ncbi:tetratricopeptide repeat protein [Saccharothrix sp. S26]|uniref:tetratricopeptide repeat protein n=1 Tax=Saccharothrix sp. S26 TaxID=2907215 RepID=UPI001F27C203|nr:tetratricopeptide repeat protein [Saccharothrix sp. S26]MCE6993579.1 tetratricopeptide repeat protein [Saccharothrix sp. S26]
MSEVHNEISGTVFGPVLQVGRVDSLTVVQPAAPVTPAGLPVDEGFVGRAAELAVLRDFLSPGGERTALAVVGLAGVGKSALVVRAAHLAVGDGWFPGGVLFVDAQGYNAEQRLSANDALASLLRVLGVPGEAIPPGQGEREALYRSQLAARPPVLVVVDNASSADQVLPLRPAGQAHRLVLTSRDNLPVPGARRVELDVMSTAEAVAVLEDAVRSVDPDDDRITADPAAAGALAESCGFLPLALRIVAEVIADRRGADVSRFAESIAAAHDRLGELAYDDSVDVRTAFNASYARLPADQARVFRLAALHPGRTVTPATAAALAGVTPDEVEALLVRLRRAHLLQRGVVADEYRFHDLLRIYAAERCAEVDDAQTRLAAERALVQHYVSHVKGVHSHLDPNAAQREVFPDRLTALAWFDGESHNLLPVLELAARNGWHEQVRDAGEAAFRYFNLRRPPEWIPVDLLALASARALGDRAGQGKILNGLGSAHHRMRRFDEALPHFQAALALFRDLGSRRDQAHSLNNIASTYALTGRVAEAIRHLELGADAYRAAGDRDGEARCLSNLGKVHGDSGEHLRAIEFYRRALRLRREVGDRDGEGDCLNGLGIEYDALGRLEDAERHYLEALAVYRAVGNRLAEGQALGNLGRTVGSLGRLAESLAYYEQDLAISQEIGHAHGEGISRYNLGLTHWSLGRREEALGQLRQAVELLDGSNDPDTAAAARDSIRRIEAEGPGRRWFRGRRTGRR